jgi:hypothetical protein
MIVPGMQCVAEALVTSPVCNIQVRGNPARLGLGAPRRTSSYRASHRAASFSELDRSSRYATVLTLMSESQLPIFDPIMPGDTLETSPETGVGGDLEGEFYG